MIMDYEGLKKVLATHARLARIIPLLPTDFLRAFRHGDFAGWVAGLQALPMLIPGSYELREGVRIGAPDQCTELERDALEQALMTLHPWRKGPFELFGLALDTEWRSDWKWERLRPHISPLAGRTVLDIGCGNGYHCWRMAGEGARFVLGADPHLLFVMQYWAIRHFLPEPAVHVMPLALEDLPARLEAFDTVFSMGVLYHRRSPLDHLHALGDCLRRGGELVLETLVIDGDVGLSLLPQERYCRMPNVWFLPTCADLENWLVKCGYKNIRLVDVSTTSVAEQRSTKWMKFDSLSQGLDPNCSDRTVEGYPAPRRAVLVAEKP
ncbi:MAG: tRNA 5-methoxyuridine(34)/uridine 5-oxyacetic acid(34) synthase CmoB [Pseudomonadales bacterium]|nr:tRNA 5-methoxyuridine(34)/uridine 5-oxyacetic acid(34) synthase CmoB [Pseudomonadales bacterium]